MKEQTNMHEFPLLERPGIGVRDKMNITPINCDVPFRMRIDSNYACASELLSIWKFIDDKSSKVKHFEDDVLHTLPWLGWVPCHFFHLFF